MAVMASRRKRSFAMVGNSPGISAQGSPRLRSCSRNLSFSSSIWVFLVFLPTDSRGFGWNGGVGCLEVVAVCLLISAKRC